MDYTLLTHKKNRLDQYRPLPTALVTNLAEWFRVELTYTSNALEGNTLTRRETALVVEKGLTVGGKTLKEHLEATNHAHALDFIYAITKRHPDSITENDILHIHNVILKGIDDDNAGHYRNVPVRISGSAVILPNPRKVPDKMQAFIAWLQQADLHPVLLAAEAHYELVTIHPFVDGNGRTARLLMNLILMMSGYPPAIIRLQDRLAYISALEKSQLGGSKEDYRKLIAQAVNRSLDIYLHAVENISSNESPSPSRLLKIGELARAVGETVPTIRYWTKEGLLEVADVTPSGYHLYAEQMVESCKRIKVLKAQRLTLEEIKKQLVFRLC